MPNLLHRLSTPLLCACCALPTAHAVETELRIGPEEWLLDTEFLNQYVDKGAVRIDGTAWRGRGRGRYFGFGLELETFLAIEDDDARDYEHFEPVELRLRADYVAEFEGYGQLIPYIETSYYPPDSFDNVEEPVWVGVEGWYMLPFEGLEAGGSLNVDAAGEHGFFVDAGMRELIQVAPLDFQAWQTINFGDDDFHQFTSGNDDSGFGVLSIGQLTTLALPWDGSFATLRTELYAWLEDDDRDVLEDDVEFVIGVGFEWRPGN